jgi:hypothetical protein
VQASGKRVPACVPLCCSPQQQLLALFSAPQPSLARALITAVCTCTMVQGSLRPFTSLPGSCFFLSLDSNLVCTCLLPAGEESATKRHMGPLLSAGWHSKSRQAVQTIARAKRPPAPPQRLAANPHPPAWLGRISHQGQSVSISSRDSGTAAITSRLTSVLREQPFIPMLQQQRTRRESTLAAH